MKIKDLNEKIARLLREAEAVYLATNGADGHPQIRAVFNLRNESQFPSLSFLNSDPDDLTVTISTNTSSRKVEEIKRDPKISAYYCRPGELLGVQLSGKAKFIEDAAVRKRIWVDGWERYYPKGPEDPDYALIVMKPTAARGWATPHMFEVMLG